MGKVLFSELGQLFGFLSDFFYFLLVMCQIYLLNMNSLIICYFSLLLERHLPLNMTLDKKLLVTLHVRQPKWPVAVAVEPRPHVIRQRIGYVRIPEP